MVSSGELRPSCPSETSSRTLAILVDKCSEFDAELRPSFELICDYLKKQKNPNEMTTTNNRVSTTEDYQNRARETDISEPSQQQQQQEYVNVQQQYNEYSNLQQQQMEASKPTAEDYLNRVKIEQKQEQQQENEYSNVQQQKMEASKQTSE
jgi:hypothetical protein